MPNSYLRSTDGSVMVEFSPGMFVSAHMAEALALLSADQIKAAVDSHKTKKRRLAA